MGLENEQLVSVKKIEAASRHLLDMINQSLDYISLNDGTFKLNPNDCNFHQFLQSLHQKLMIKARDKYLNVTFYIDPSLPERVCTDTHRLEQLFLIIADNAVKFNEFSGDVHVTVHSESLSGDWIKVFLKVKDTGVGIHDADQSQLFKLFAQVDGTNQRHFNGLGLGLCLATRIVEMMNGHISVMSEYGKGSEFVIDFELKQLTNQPVVKDEAISESYEPDVIENQPTTESDDKPGHKPLKRHLVEPILQKLYVLLDNDDADSVELIKSLERKINGTHYQGDFQNLYKEVTGYDFEQAKISLQDFIQCIRKEL